MFAMSAKVTTPPGVKAAPGYAKQCAQTIHLKAMTVLLDKRKDYCLFFSKNRRAFFRISISSSRFASAFSSSLMRLLALVISASGAANGY
jgi:hypothetical protein